ncbi:hypothetical protein NFI96_030550, partial [Prochilodus magdalenae]
RLKGGDPAELESESSGGFWWTRSGSGWYLAARMSRVEALGVFWCHFLLAHLSRGGSAELTEGLTARGGGTFRRSSNREQHTQTWRHIQDSVKRQTLLNSQSVNFPHPAKYGLNQFSHLTPQQFRDLYLRARPEVAPRYNLTKHSRLGSKPYPPRFDWRVHGAVGPIQNQQACGGCWAFSVVAAIEAVSVKDGGTLQDLSVQQVIDCAYKSQGCDGGSTVSTLGWLKQTKEKLVNETEYPYKAETGGCGRVFSLRFIWRRHGEGRSLQGVCFRSQHYKYRWENCGGTCSHCPT